MDKMRFSRRIAVMQQQTGQVWIKIGGQESNDEMLASKMSGV